ncbi:trigger factor [Candidatus Termititenax persephonae]|uniref:Trigger factor n=1 Tax=Candidatus Termititenax persephonae TaxID=2218525 RepID=A0A388THM8_9BACT|nr:trigger factor [Candidatus Termititenax persephonae]
MKVLKNKRDNFTVSLEIETEYADLLKATEPAFRELAKDAKIPGFRQGKAPRHIFEKHYGTGILLERASTIVMNDCYRQAVEAEKLQPVDYPKNVDIKALAADKPFVFTLTVDVKPEVKLGKYKGLKGQKLSGEVQAAEIDKELAQMREYHAEYKAVERPAQKDDLVGYAIKAFTLDGQPVADLTKERTGTRLGANFLSPDFEQAVIGMQLNETKKFKLKVNADYFIKAVAGQEIEAEVLLLEIKERVLPELNDEFIKKVSAKQTVAEMRAEIKNGLAAQKKQLSDNKIRETIVEELLKENDFAVPEALVQDKVTLLLRNLEMDLRQRGLTFDKYLPMVNKSLEDVRRDYRPTAEKRAKLDLLLDKIAEKEGIQPSDTAVDDELTRILNDGRKEPLPPEELAKYKKSVPPATKEHIVRYLTEDKTLDFLLNNAKITG